MDEKEKQRILRRIYGMPSPVPQTLIDLFQFTKKSNLVKYAKTIEISSSDLSDLIHNCRSIGYTHMPQWDDITPPHLQGTLSDIRKAMVAGSPEIHAYMRRKTRALLIEHNQMSYHFFINDDQQWHLLYFTFHDTGRSGVNHWQGGTHIHFINYLWPTMNLPLLKEIFSSGNPKFSGAIHIKWVDK